MSAALAAAATPLAVRRSPTPPEHLRPRQKEAFKAVFENLAKGIDSMLVALPTGVGKTHLAIAVAHQFNHVLFLVHRTELLKQTIASYHAAGNQRSIATITSASRAVAPDAHFTVGMIQTLAGRLGQYPPGRFDLVIVDEAHHAMAREWRTVIEHFNPELHLGLSATPERQDGAPLSHLYSVLAYHMSVADAVREGALVEPIAMEVQTGTDLSKVKRSRGDYDAGELQTALNTPERNKLILDTFLKHGKGRKAVAFTAGVNHAKELERLFTKAGIPSIAISGADKDREEKLKDLEDGKYLVGFNALLLTEGWDDPSVDCVLMCRPTQSKPLYVQAVGRGLRLKPGKKDCLIIDFSDASRTHRLVSIWDFWGSRVKRSLKDPTNLPREADRKDVELEPGGNWSLQAYLELVNLLEPPPLIDEFVLGAFKWHHEPATEKQIRMLADLGYDVDPGRVDWTKGQASAVIGREPASDSQVRLLIALGFDAVGRRWTRNEASRAIAQAQEKGRKPDWSVLKKLRAA